MKHVENKKALQTTLTKLAAASAGLLICLGAPSMQASASGTNTVLPKVGVAAILDNKLSTEEYIEAARQAEGACWGYTNIGIAHVDNWLNVREQPSLDGKLVGKMPQDSACEVLEILDGWAHIQSGDVEGYVSLEYLMTGMDAWLRARELAETRVTVNADNLNVRTEPNIDSEILGKAQKGMMLKYLDTLEGWVKVEFDNIEAYVSTEYVTVKDELTTAITMTEVKYGVGVTDVRADLVEYALQFEGNPYVHGGTSLTNGADCSGFIFTLFKKYGYNLPRCEGDQAKCGTAVSFSELQPGDLIFYNNEYGNIGHVALYIGNSRIIHASNSRTGIITANYNYRTPAKYVRILDE